MLAKDIMTTQVITVPPNTSIKETIKLLVEIDIGGLMVVNENNELIGVVSEKDLMVAYNFLGQTKASIEEYMNRNLISVSEETPVEEVSDILIEKNVKRVPVVRGKNVVGVISRKDILRYIYKHS